MNQDNNSLKDKKILVVDDSRSIRKLISIILSSQGADILQAGAVRASLKYLCDREPNTVLPDIVLLDVHMP